MHKRKFTMSENDFQPHTDEELARLLEEQMKALRPTSAPTVPERQDAITPSGSVDTSENALDELFGALLDDSPSLSPADPFEAASEKPVIDESALGLTQPIEYVSPEPLVDSAVSVEVEEEVLSSSDPLEPGDGDTSDVLAVTERVLQDIDTQGVVVATTIAATASPEPVPGMFGMGPSEAAPEMVNDSPATDLLQSNLTLQDQAAEFVRRVNQQESGFATRPRFDDVVFGQGS